MTFTLLCRMANMVEPPDGAPPFFQALTLILNSSSSLMLPSLSSLKTTSCRHQFGEARGRDQLIGILVEEHGAGLGLDQDRVGAPDWNPLSSFLVAVAMPPPAAKTDCAANR